MLLRLLRLMGLCHFCTPRDSAWHPGSVAKAALLDSTQVITCAMPRFRPVLACAVAVVSASARRDCASAMARCAARSPSSATLRCADRSSTSLRRASACPCMHPCGHMACARLTHMHPATGLAVWPFRLCNVVWAMCTGTGMRAAAHLGGQALPAAGLSIQLRSKLAALGRLGARHLHVPLQSRNADLPACMPAGVS